MVGDGLRKKLGRDRCKVRSVGVIPAYDQKSEPVDLGCKTSMEQPCKALFIDRSQRPISLRRAISQRTMS